MLSRRLETAAKFVDHYATHDNEVLNTLLSDDLLLEFSPSRSLDHAKTLDKAGYLEFKRGMKLTQTGYPLDVKKYIEGESANSESFEISLYDCLVLLFLFSHHRSRFIHVHLPIVFQSTLDGNWRQAYVE